MELRGIGTTIGKVSGDVDGGVRDATGVKAKPMSTASSVLFPDLMPLSIGEEFNPELDYPDDPDGKVRPVDIESFATKLF